MTPSVRTLQGSKQKGFRGSTPLCPRGSNARGFSNMFCYFNVDDFSNITIKCESSEMVELKEHYQAVSEPFNGDKRYWISVQPNMDLSDADLKELILKSYEIVRTKYTKHK